MQPSALQDSEFLSLLERIGGFEYAPKVGVAVSGGADSMALTLLCRRWVRVKGGELYGFIVDHGLRLGSREEVQTVGRWLSSLGIVYDILTWEGDKPCARIQEEARRVRYRLLIKACVERGILHLFLAQHQDDQVETFLQRLSKGSGIIGLGGMSWVREGGEVRFIRPLLGVTKERLIETCRVAGQVWIEDPENYSQRFSRGRLRQSKGTLERIGFSTHTLSLAVRRLGFARMTIEKQVARLSADRVVIYPEGYLILDMNGLWGRSFESVVLLLERVLGVISRRVYPPRRRQLERLYWNLKHIAGYRGTLGGCRIVGHGAEKCLILREYREITDVRLLQNGQSVYWDGRFLLSLGLTEKDQGQTRHFTVMKLGKRKIQGFRSELPEEVVPTLPALWEKEEVVLIPHLLQRPTGLEVRFIPKQTLTAEPFMVV